MDITNAINEFKSTIVSRGHPKEIVWLQGSQLCLTNKELSIYMANGFPYEKHIVSAYNKFSSDLECGAALMLVTTDAKTSYATLLLDSFGSDDDIEFESEHFYLWCDPYVGTFKSVTSSLEWFWKTIVHSNINQRLSSLDYAFILNKSIT